MDATRLDLVALRRPVDIQFPNDKVFRIAPFRGHGKALLRQFYEDPTDGNVLAELLRLAVPDATDEDLNTLSLEEDVTRILAAADGKAALVEAFLKNVESDGATPTPSPTPPLSPTMTSSTSSPSWPTGPAAGSRTSTTTRGMKRSSSSRGARKSPELTG